MQLHRVNPREPREYELEIDGTFLIMRKSTADFITGLINACEAVAEAQGIDDFENAKIMANKALEKLAK